MVTLADFDGVLLDLDGVLLDYPTAEAQAFAGVAMRAGLHDVAAARRAYATINVGLWQDYERGDVTAERLRVARWERLLDHHGLDPGGAERVSAQYLDLLGRSPAVMAGAVQALRRLAARVPVVAVTNGFATIARGRLAAAGVRDDLAGLVAADEVAAPKPHAAMFTTGLSLLGDPPPRRVLMVGDNHHADIVGAHAVGLVTVWITTHDDPEPQPQVADHRAGSLADLVARATQA